MNKEESNMDKMFREKLDGFSQQPPLHVWNNIESQLLAQKRKKKIVFFSRVAAAAVVILAFIAGWYYSEQTKEVVPQTVSNESVEQEVIIQKQENTLNSTEQFAGAESIHSIQKNNESTFSSSENTEKVSIENRAETEQPSDELRPLERIRLKLLESKKAKIEVQNEIKISVAEISEDRLTREDRILIAENLKNMETNNSEEAKWKMGVLVSPGYSSQSVNYSENYSNNMVHSENDGNGNVTGGISVQYKTGKKWSIETGLYYEQNGKSSVNPGNNFSKKYEYADLPLYDTDGLYFNDAVNSVNGTLAMNSIAGIIEFSEIPAGTEIVANLDGTSLSSSNVLMASGEYSQVFEFVELPLYIRYSVLDSKFGLEIMGGVNTGIVTGNFVYLEKSGNSRNIGKTKDISKVNFSGTVGLGVNYALGKRISLSVEPRFNYYLNSINQNPDISFKPYRIGVYTGLHYAF